MIEIKQSGIYLANLDPVKGHEQSGYRPVLVLQNDILNKNLNTVIVAPLTKNLTAKGHITTYFIDKRISKLNFDSVALLFQIRTIDKLRIQKQISNLDETMMKRIKIQMALMF